MSIVIFSKIDLNVIAKIKQLLQYFQQYLPYSLDKAHIKNFL